MKNTKLSNVEVFSAGPQTDSRGNTRTWTEAELDEMVKNFQAEGDTVPAVVGHPKDDAPAYGWMHSLKRVGSKLVASFRDVERTFADMVTHKRFPNRSVKVVKSDAGWQLGHVGWLGAAAPAVPGLKPVQFAEPGDAGEVHVYSTEPAAPPEPKPEPTPMPPNADPKFSQADIDAAVEKANAAHKAELETLREKNRKAEFAQRLADSREKVKELAVREDKVHITPAQQEGLAEFRARLASLDTEVAEFTFTAADKEEKKVSLVAHFDAFLKALPAQMKVGQETATTDPAKQQATAFNAPVGAAVDEDQVALYNKAATYQREHPDTPWVDCVLAVSE